MTPREKAEDLFAKFKKEYMVINGGGFNKELAKVCAKLCVDEIDEAIDFDWMEVQNLDRQHAYWEEVKIQIDLI